VPIKQIKSIGALAPAGRLPRRLRTFFNNFLKTQRNLEVPHPGMAKEGNLEYHPYAIAPTTATQ
jgi:hypothetical protein